MDRGIVFLGIGSGSCAEARFLKTDGRDGVGDPHELLCSFVYQFTPLLRH